MSFRAQVIFWAATVTILALALYVLRTVLLPFVLGAVIAYALDPVAGRLQRRGFGRGAATAVLIVAFFGLGLLVFALLAPVVVNQVIGLIAKVPDYARALGAYFQPMASQALKMLGVRHVPNLDDTVVQVVQQLAGTTGGLVQGVLSGGARLIGFVSLLALTPVVAAYLLHQWPRLVAAVDGWLPRDHADDIRGIAGEIDSVLTGFLYGTAIICSSLGLFYGIALSLIGLDYGLTIGLIAGAVSFIPYLGTVVGLGSSLGLAAYQFWPDWVSIGGVVVVFVVGQVVADHLLTPRIMGDRLALHPLWVIFGIIAGGALFGFVGLLVAVPVSAVVGVLARFAIRRYKQSQLYLGKSDDDIPA